MAGKSTYTDEQKRKTQLLWRAELPSKEIVRLVGLNNSRIIYKWADEENWTRDIEDDSLQLQLSIRYQRIVSSKDEKETFTKQERSECDWILDQMLKVAKIDAINRGEAVGRGRTPNVKNGQGKAKEKKRKKNDVSHLTAEDFAKFREEHLYPHQKVWWEAGQNPETRDTRFILKSRKIGASWFCAYEAFEDLTLNHNDQAFISATRQQAEVFKTMIAAIAREFFDLEITGNPSQIKNDKKTNSLHYLSSSHFSAQTFGGNIYFDEVFWTRSFTRLFDVASPIASFDEHKTTLISTPSSISHEAYAKWTGKEYNEGRAEEDQVSFSVSHKALKEGRLCEDYIWRQVITLEDAVESGFDRITVEKIKQKTAPHKYDNFYGAKFVDDTNSYFNLNELLKLGVENLHEQIGYDPESDRPFGNRQTSIGYDPGGKVHFDATALLDVPTSDKNSFNLLDFELMRNMPSFDQFSVVKNWMDTHNVIHFEFDTTGPGQDMEKYATAEFPNCTPVRYNPAYKTAMVNKASSLFSRGRFAYDISNKEVPLAFMTIFETTTPKTGQLTYASRETQESGHGDLAWAIMHGFMVEELIPDRLGLEIVEYH